MTASDHLKQRLATGSLGGDQDEKAVEELIAENERLEHGWSDCNDRLNGFIRLCAHAAKERDEARAALAQKTRECEELRQWKSEQMLVESEWDAQAVGRELGIAWGSSIRAGIMPAIKDLKAQLEQLGRQVAEMRSNEQDALRYGADLGKINIKLSAQIAEMTQALQAWEHWYNVDSTEFNRDTARDMGLKALASQGPEKRKSASI